ncbi:hypothetical protein [Kordiimonas sp. SCSIO 12610]|uniref:hypothetical protein n=1 Tax=Kordiimonas sp. SCSIO 12610 TaxID=2829597 RepID=UPI002109DBFE|nr:hypothetical protein [Kordiimonas sp. SCSIO 12610]UTW56209.1 hypothetical protein KFF44_04735 [Kordiimonas sp. SCSIO 12610]
MRKYFDIVKGYGLPDDDFAIFGSGPLIVRGLIEGSNDLDIICRGSAWDRVQKIGTTEFLPDYNVTIVSTCNGDITFGTEWGIGNPDIDTLIDSAEMIEGLPFVHLSHVIEYKLIRSSNKDKHHMELLEKSGYGELVHSARSRILQNRPA